MQTKIDIEVQQQIQNLTTIHLQDRDYYFFVDWLLRVGVATVNTALKQHPELTLGDLVMMQFRNEIH